MKNNHCCKDASHCSYVQELSCQIKEMKEKNSELQYELNELRVKGFGRSTKSAKDKVEMEKPKAKKKGAPLGHKGWFRTKPEQIDEVEEVELSQCPTCGNLDLKECAEIEEHIQEDIVLPKVKVTKYRKHHYWCGHCGATVSGKGKEEMANSYIGPQAKAVAGFLKYAIKVSDRDIKRIFKELCGLDIVSSSIPGFNNQARIRSLPVYNELKAELTKAPYIHADETGCPVDGKNWWDWIFASPNICLHVIRHSRGQNVVEEILGKTYDGILISDFLSAYNKIDAKAKQRCLVHLLRDLKKILECYKPEDFGYAYCQRLKDLILKAMELGKRYNDRQISDEQFALMRKNLHEVLEDFQFPDPQNKPIRRIAKRLSRHKNELFTFLNYPGLPCHNNFAEQQIRPSVLLRKITFGHRSEKGTLNHSVLMSVIQTGKLNSKESIPILKDLLINQKQISARMCLGP